MKKKVKKPNEIIINDNYIVSYENYIKISNKEKYFKDVFISILKDNYDDSVIRLVDIKSEYLKRLSNVLQSDKNLIQILKNLIGSNKDNSTSLVRDPNVDWYYCNEMKSGTITVTQCERKPIQLPKKLERSRKKKYFAFYSSLLEDSIVTDSIEAEIDNSASTTDSYDSIDFTKIPLKKINYIDKQIRSQKIGDVGEKYILDIEERNVKSLNIDEKPIWVSRTNDSYGFDILTYRKNATGIIEKVYIEVKTTNGGLDNIFYVTDIELAASKKIKNYVLARVYNAGDIKLITHKEFKGDLSQNTNLEKVNEKSKFIYKIK
ncbi:MAG: DUF3883 domain-containing protein [Acholeplasmatales bacterium]|nr:DUF3883 domain-containing protein [Acholeplasmatales bacterium]